MKKLIVLFVIVSLLSSCKNKDKSEPENIEHNIESVAISLDEYEFSSVGETVQLTVTTVPQTVLGGNITWESSNVNVATVDERGRVTCLKGGMAMILAIVNGKADTCMVYTNVSQVVDCQGHVYPVVKIGKQFWMAENLKCSVYSANSDAERKYELPTKKEVYFQHQVKSGHDCIIPSYTDATDKENWDMSRYKGDLTETQISKLGFLYNFTAVVGLYDADELSLRGKMKKLNAKLNNSRRQGICPDGWHLPNEKERVIRDEYIESVLGYNYYFDPHGFAAISSGLVWSDGYKVRDVGTYGYYFWMGMGYPSSNLDGLSGTGQDTGGSGCPVRCIRDY
jgi:uncharacterized protein (TIGR02145 family)